MDTHPYAQAIGHILTLRTIVARAGEKDNMGWWDSDALSSAGSYVLQRLFPRSVSWAGIRLAIEAATIRHRAVLGDQTALSLFQLGEEWEPRVNSRLGQSYGGGAPPLIPRSVQSPSELQAVLEECGDFGLGNWAAPDLLELFDSHTLEVGQVRAPRLLSPEEMVRWTSILAASYAKGEKGRLVVPYIRVLQP
jgi:hypothetical protein